MINPKIKALFILSFLLNPIFPVQAATDPEIHKLCLQAKDYKGCVNSQTNNQGSEKTNTSKEPTEQEVLTAVGYLAKAKCFYQLGTLPRKRSLGWAQYFIGKSKSHYIRPQFRSMFIKMGWDSNTPFGEMVALKIKSAGGCKKYITKDNIEMAKTYLEVYKYLKH